MERQTVRDLLQLLVNYHQSRHDIYANLISGAKDDRAAMLLKKLTDLESQTLQVVHEELESRDPANPTYLSNTPPVHLDPLPMPACDFNAGASFEETLECVWKADEALPEVIDRLANASSAESVQKMAERLGELEKSKEREVANFTRMD
ncbi:MAG: hypothetical protein WDZ51_02090 [Pirellulaceae bacterium]